MTDKIADADVETAEVVKRLGPLSEAASLGGIYGFCLCPTLKDGSKHSNNRML